MSRTSGRGPAPPSLACALSRRFWANSRGNVAITFGLLAVPIVMAVGCVVDFSMATMLKSKLQAAADTATLATVSIKSPVIATAQAMTGNGAVANGASYATTFFNSNLTNVTGLSNVTPTASVTRTGMKIQATISYTAQVATFFLGIMGYRNLSVSGSSTSSYTLPTYIDFYLVLDVSGSMAFPSTASEQTRLEAINPDNYTLYPGGCTFACHFTAQGACPDSEQKYSTNGYCMGYALTRTAGNSSNTPVTSCPTPGTSACIQLQADAVGYAVNQLLQTAATSAQVTNQFRVGLYPFIQHLETYFGLTSTLNGSPNTAGTINYAAAQLASLLDTGQDPALGSGGTHFENALPSINTMITSVGTGSGPSSTLPYVFLITDGAQDNQVQWSGSWSGSNNATVIDTSLCTTLKNRGITVAVLYIPYQTIQNPTNFANGEDFAVNAIIPPNGPPNIPTSLQACASPNFFYTGDSPAHITSALITMFEQAVSTAHVTN